MLDWLALYWPMIVSAAVLAMMLYFILGTVYDAFRGRDGDDHEPPTLNTRGPDPDDPTSGAH